MPRQREGGASRQPRRMAFHEVMGSFPISSTSPGARSASSPRCLARRFHTYQNQGFSDYNPTAVY